MELLSADDWPIFSTNLQQFMPRNSENCPKFVALLENGTSQIRHIIGTFLGFRGLLALKYCFQHLLVKEVSIKATSK